MISAGSGEVAFKDLRSPLTVFEIHINRGYFTRFNLKMFSMYDSSTKGTPSGNPGVAGIIGCGTNCCPLNAGCPCAKTGLPKNPAGNCVNHMVADKNSSKPPKNNFRFRRERKSSVI